MALSNIYQTNILFRLLNILVRSNLLEKLRLIEDTSEDIVFLIGKMSFD